MPRGTDAICTFTSAVEGTGIRFMLHIIDRHLKIAALCSSRARVIMSAAAWFPSGPYATWYGSDAPTCSEVR